MPQNTTLALVPAAPVVSNATPQSYDDAANIVRAANPDTAALTANDLYLQGNHYQNGTAWGGPPVPQGIAGYSETVTALERDQAPVPVLEEISEHYVTGVVGTEPAFGIELARELEEDEEPSETEAADMTLLNSALTAFYDGCGASEPIQQFVENLCSGRAVLRPMVPPDVIEQTGGNFTDVLEAIKNIYLEAPAWSEAAVHLNRHSMKKTGVYLYSETTGADAQSEQYAEITSVNDEGKTVFQVVKAQGQADEPRVYDCAGNIWLFEAKLPKPILGRAQRELQRKIDFLNYILPKNAQFAGFRERNFVGVNRPKNDDGTYADFTVGPGKIGFWQPAVVDIDGEKKTLPATLVFTEPVDSGPIREDIAHLIEVLLKSRHLLHTVQAGDAAASAISRIQSRAQFTRALTQMKVKVERVLRDLFMTVLCMACEFSGETGLLERLKTDYRIRVDVRIDAGPMTPEEVLAVVTLYEKGLIDLETAQQMVGIEDIASVHDALLRDEDTNLDMQIKRAQLFNEYSQTFDAKDAAELAGLPETITKKIQAIGGGDVTEDDDADEA